MRETKLCRFCGNVIYSDEMKCKYCKRDLNIEDTPDMFCTKCKAPVNIDDNFCQKCGAIFNIPEEPLPQRRNLLGIPYNLGIFLTSLAISFAITILAGSGKETTFINNIIVYGIAFVASEIVLYFYFLPSIIAIENNHSNTFLIYICNLLFGVTIIGWFVTLIIAMQSNENAK